jgi:hypothetical protein
MSIPQKWSITDIISRLRPRNNKENGTKFSPAFWQATVSCGHRHTQTPKRNSLPEITLSLREGQSPT